ncbi:DgyrCDS8347 [Dimorphilus gyrociliatus]|uniref:DgyrCDS8347 n=1 Tax=Dimorphilus gyrociliatus TaxID=2664684 RepID=A0A7I8VVK2_9ANNE|nr:DgyrCDS8347 [Dimorphilus gyrociliatus]
MNTDDHMYNDRQEDYFSRLDGRRVEKDNLPEKMYYVLKNIEEKSRCYFEYVKIGTDLTFNPGLPCSLRDYDRMRNSCEDVSYKRQAGVYMDMVENVLNGIHDFNIAQQDIMKKTAPEIPQKQKDVNIDRKVTYVEKKRKILIKQERQVLEKKVQDYGEKCQETGDNLFLDISDHTYCKGK